MGLEYLKEGGPEPDFRTSGAKAARAVPLFVVSGKVSVYANFTFTRTLRPLPHLQKLK
ncbi:MAG: hypothetical protein J6A23_14850 [Thermoguttaceae bacterium]|nr:hypothetical protein [Thermoguttaceae bacterium]